MTAAAGSAGSDDYSVGTASATFRQSGSPPDFTRTNVGGNFRYRAVKEFSVNILPDTTEEPNATFTATVDYQNAEPHLPGGDDDLTVTINDDDLSPVTIARDSATASEEDGSITFTLTRVGLLDSSLHVNVRVTETRDMLRGSPPARATFAANERTASLTVNLSGGAVDEDDSTVTVEAVGGSGYLPGTDRSPHTTVQDDDHVAVTLRREETAATVDESVGTYRINPWAPPPGTGRRRVDSHSTRPLPPPTALPRSPTTTSGSRDP